jgi:hypothetical protein
MTASSSAVERLRGVSQKRVGSGFWSQRASSFMALDPGLSRAQSPLLVVDV